MNNLGFGPGNILAGHRANQMRLMQMGRAPTPMAASAPRPQRDMGTQLGQGLGAIGKMLGQFGAQRDADEKTATAQKAVLGLVNSDRNQALATQGGPTLNAAAAHDQSQANPSVPPRLAKVMRALSEGGDPMKALQVYQQWAAKDRPESKPTMMRLFHPNNSEKYVDLPADSPLVERYEKAGWGLEPGGKAVEKWINIASPEDRARYGIPKSDAGIYQISSTTGEIRGRGGKSGVTVNVNPDAQAGATLAKPLPQVREASVGALGVPFADTNPLEGLGPKEAGKLSADIRSGAIKQFQQSREAIDQASGMMQDVSRFLQIMDDGLETGGALALPFAGDVAAPFSPEIAEAKSIGDKLTPQMRQGMPGSASDRDVAMFRGATINIDKPNAANRNIGMGILTSRQNLLDRDAYMQAYFDQNKHLQGADRHWKRYLEANPIFSPDAAKGSYELNQNRASWRDFFSGQASDVDKFATMSVDDLVRDYSTPEQTKALSPEERAALQKRVLELRGGDVARQAQP
jgi:hypothetical protein